jgi:Lon protease-like protein
MLLEEPRVHDMHKESLALFPLQVVLFPKSALPIHIFEERYKILINERLDGQKAFGINLMEGNRVSEVGCTAIVRNVRRRYPDGRMDIEVEGRRRYRLLGYEAGESPYLVGVVQYIETEPEQVDEELVEDTLKLYGELLAIVYRKGIRQIAVKLGRENLAFELAQKAGMTLSQRQHLLELSSENERMRVLHSYLTDVIPRLQRSEELERVIHGNGYL